MQQQAHQSLQAYMPKALANVVQLAERGSTESIKLQANRLLVETCTVWDAKQIERQRIKLMELELAELQEELANNALPPSEDPIDVDLEPAAHTPAQQPETDQLEVES